MSELIIKVEWYSPVEISYNGYRIMSQEDWKQLQELIQSDTQVPYTNTPKWWEESFPASGLSDSFSIFSGPGAEHPGFDAPMTEEEHQNTLESFKKLFPDGDVGDTSIIDSVFDAELNSDDGGDFEQMDEDGEEDEERKVLTREIAELALNDQNTAEEVELNEFTSIEDEAAESLSKFPGEPHRQQSARRTDEEIANKVQEFCDPELDPVNWDFQSLSDWASLTFPGGVSADLLAGLVEGKAAAGTDNERDMTPHQRLLFDDISAKAKEGEFPAELYLNGLTELSSFAAESLSKVQAGLNLSGLTELSDAAAESLSKHQGSTLSLDGIMGLGNRTAKSLAKFQGHSLFLGITTTSDPVAKIMSEFKCGQLWLSLMEISDEAAVSLSQFKGELGLTWLSELSDAAAKSLSKHSGEDLHFSTEIEISDLAMNYLSKYKGRINCMDPKEWLESMKDG